MIHSPLRIFLLALVLCTLTAGGHLYSPDEEIMYRTTAALAGRGQLDIEPLSDGTGGFATRTGVNGREYAQYGVANSFLGIPFYWVGAALCRVMPEETARHALSFKTTGYVADGPSLGHELLKRFAVSFAGSFVAAATAALLWMFTFNIACGCLLPGDHRRSAGIVAFAYLAGTIAWPHARTYFSEPLATFFLLLSFYLAWGKGAEMRLGQAFASGCAFAGALFTRLDSAAMFPGVALLVFSLLPGLPFVAAEPNSSVTAHFQRAKAWVVSRCGWNQFFILGAFGKPMLCFVLVYLALNHVHFGNAFSSAYSDQREGIRFSTPLLAGLYGFSMSIGKSVFLFSPAIILGLAGFNGFFKKMPVLAWGCTLAIVAKLLLHASWQNWSGGWCWGPRHIFQIHVFAMLPAIFWTAGMGMFRSLIVKGVVLIGALVQIYGCSQNFIDFYVLYYRTPYTVPNALAFYSQEDMAPRMFKLERFSPDGQMQPVSFATLIAPLNDSIYVPQNSQWYRYVEMWNEGYTDNLWLRWLQRARDREPEVN